jgi:hypothetical protein
MMALLEEHVPPAPNLGHRSKRGGAYTGPAALAPAVVAGKPASRPPMVNLTGTN